MRGGTESFVEFVEKGGEDTLCRGVVWEDLAHEVVPDDWIGHYGHFYTFYIGA